MTPLEQDDIPDALDWLSRNRQGTIFLEANLRKFGLSGDPYSVRIWRAGTRAMAGLTEAGVLLPQMTDATEDDWRALAQRLKGRAITGMNGVPSQIARLRDLPGLAGAKASLDEVEPGFSLELSDLVMPRLDGLRLAPIRAEDAAAMAAWRAAYMVEILGQDIVAAEPEAARQIARYRAEGSHRILWQEDTPVAFTGFNARLPGLVQIGGVYTPPDLRGRGFARAAVALHLAEARAAGTRTARLFAASDSAARAYRAIGFQRAGDVALVMFAEPSAVS